MHEVRKKDTVIKDTVIKAKEKRRRKKKEDVQLQKDMAEVKILYLGW